MHAVGKATKSRGELEALILERAREFGVADVIRAVTVRPLPNRVAGANWIVVTANPAEGETGSRLEALRLILPVLRQQFDLGDDDKR